MNYYKIIKDSTFIGVISSDNFRKYNRRHQFLGPATENDGELVDYMGNFYRDTWMVGITTELPYQYTQAIILAISQEEYEDLNVRLEDDREKTVDYETMKLVPEEKEEPVVNFYDVLTLNEMKDLKIKQMSAECHSIIENGFDLELRGEMHHFSLDSQDQLNLMRLEMIAQTEDKIPYHADGEECIFFTSEEIKAIVTAADAFRTYHTTYFNSLKTYINALETREEIAAVKYGDAIPESLKSEVLKAIE